MEIISQTVLDAAGQWWIYPLLLVFFFVDGFAMVVPSETLIVALAAFSRQSGEPKLWILGVTALLGAIAGENTAYVLGRKIGLERWGWMRKPKVRKVFGWAQYELEKRGAVLIFTARYIPWGRVAVHYVAGTTAFPRRRFFFLDAFACITWVVYSVGLGMLAGSSPGCTATPCSATAWPWRSQSLWASSSTTSCAGGTNASAATTPGPLQSRRQAVSRRTRRPHRRTPWPSSPEARSSSQTNPVGRKDGNWTLLRRRPDEVLPHLAIAGPGKVHHEPARFQAHLRAVPTAATLP